MVIVNERNNFLPVDCKKQYVLERISIRILTTRLLSSKNIFDKKIQTMGNAPMKKTVWVLFFKCLLHLLICGCIISNGADHVITEAVHNTD